MNQELENVVRESMFCSGCGKRLITRVLLREQMVAGLVLQNTRSGCCGRGVSSLLEVGPRDAAMDPSTFPNASLHHGDPLPHSAEFAMAGDREDLKGNGDTAPKAPGKGKTK